MIRNPMLELDPRRREKIRSWIVGCTRAKRRSVSLIVQEGSHPIGKAATIWIRVANKKNGDAEMEMKQL